ncbi:hypothetical protein EGR_07856 [Echinococcus granulosus]|uniref:Uncharacterized protein n=1 Tax=Echinococcus granulosus TaxID=6210 RepID=W6U837_ECHGR|nr:hypothetical protein EGR_07856 [Echinococcus granulosus]EUB57320.1 hypothetical protein EGR_07856 [Echinococcus granulosus]
MLPKLIRTIYADGCCHALVIIQKTCNLFIGIYSPVKCTLLQNLTYIFKAQTRRKKTNTLLEFLWKWSVKLSALGCKYLQLIQLLGNPTNWRSQMIDFVNPFGINIFQHFDTSNAPTIKKEDWFCSFNRKNAVPTVSAHYFLKLLIYLKNISWDNRDLRLIHFPSEVLFRVSGINNDIYAEGSKSSYNLTIKEK